MLRIAPFFLFLAAVKAACDNQCSGHGTCMLDDICNCYDNWGIGLSHDSGDCSDRVCPFEIAWVDVPGIRVNTFHKYTECAGQGICDRSSGECQCFDGYEGKACQRFSCPNDCSGHGTCEIIEDSSFAASWNDYSVTGFEHEAKKFDYHLWDARKTRQCKCDALYGDVDCSKKMCPYGTDILAHRDNLLVSEKYQTQNFVFMPSRVDEDVFSSDNYVLRKDTFAFTFRSRLNETFTTIPIVFDGQDIPDFVHDIQLALLSLPNRVIDGVTVAASSATVYGHSNADIYVNITFTGPSVQGPQHMLAIEDYECSSGCTPKLTGLTVMRAYNQYQSNITELQLSDFNSFECGRRGVCDYTSGLCNCFVGYTGDNCNTLTTLV